MKPFSRWLRSMRYAYEGIKHALVTQPNMKFHFFACFAVLSSALFFRLPRTDILLLLLAVTLVIVTELINTAIEKTVDLAMPERHPLAKIAKDTAAAAVLATAVFAVITGIMVFYGPLERWLRGVRSAETPAPAGSVWIYLALVVLTVIVTQTRFANSRLIRPSLLAAVAFSIAALITLLTRDLLVSLLAYIIAALFFIILYEKRGRTLGGLLLGAALGTFITILAFLLNH